ncbi:hypothetical protein ALC60_08493 [Trachymyrmex zeteki]|uniref:Uncharacterized protein n=1 Tax=Mycetomoellerius zeteki TaxID=64791 RepID=A0A151WX93_9HYME|nr:hypothetical protein ALC60_08493 [Trachymyrmex zeteki]
MRGCERTLRLSLSGMRAEANTRELNAPFIALEYRSASRRDPMTLVSLEQCERRSYFRIKELNPFYPGLDHVRT